MRGMKSARMTRVDEAQSTQNINCRTHGPTTWLLTFMCSVCGAVYQASDPDATRHVPKNGRCECGRKLMPEHPADKPYDERNLSGFTAGIICTECFKAKLS